MPSKHAIDRITLAYISNLESFATSWVLPAIQARGVYTWEALAQTEPPARRAGLVVPRLMIRGYFVGLPVSGPSWTGLVALTACFQTPPIERLARRHVVGAATGFAPAGGGVAVGAS
jgi:hypothetical protein